MVTLREKLDELDTPFDLQELFMEGIKHYLYGTPAPTPQAPHLQEIAEAQDTVGWDQLFKGRLVLQWQQRQQQHMIQSNLITDKRNGQTWSTQVVATVFGQWWKLWDLRNSDRHGRDLITKAEAAKRQAIRELQQLYDLKDQVPPQHQWILSVPIESRLQWSTPMLRAFISSYKPILEEGYTTRLETG